MSRELRAARLAMPWLTDAGAALIGLTPDAVRRREAVCATNRAVPHGVGHNSVCVCGCGWCVEERAAQDTGPVQRDLFGEAA